MLNKNNKALRMVRAGETPEDVHKYLAIHDSPSHPSQTIHIQQNRLAALPVPASYNIKTFSERSSDM